MERIVDKWVRERAYNRHADAPYIAQITAQMCNTNTFYTVSKGRDYVDEDRNVHPGRFTTYTWHILIGDEVRVHADKGPAVFTVLKQTNQTVDEHWYKFGICTDNEDLEDDNDPTEVLDWFLSNGSDEPLVVQRLVKLGAEISDDALIDAAGNDLPQVLDFLLSQRQVENPGELLKEAVTVDSLGVLNYFLNSRMFDCNAVFVAIFEGVYDPKRWDEILESCVRHAISKNTPEEDTLVRCLISNSVHHDNHFVPSVIERNKYQLLEFLLERGGLCVDQSMVEFACRLGHREIIDLLERYQTS